MKPIRHEDEYIWVQELQQRIAKLEKEQQAESEAEKRRLKEAHCKGVWLDKGELGAIVESTGQGSFFHTCLRILRGGQPPSVPPVR